MNPIAKTDRAFPEMRCFVLMPFGSGAEYHNKTKEADAIYKKVFAPAIQKALNITDSEAKIAVVREVDKGEAGQITRSIIQRISEAELVLVDITGLNPNVFFEMGVRYALSRSGTVLVRQPGMKIPFDIANYRHFEYDRDDDDAVEGLAEVIRVTMESARSGRTDSPVYDVYPSLEVETNISGKNRMPWREYQWRIDEIRKLLWGAYSNKDPEKAYRPNAIIGITKGGASFADLLTQKMTGYDVATLALWANRPAGQKKPPPMFDNAVNRGMLEGLASMLSETKDPRILLADEVVASGTTFQQAVALILERLPGCHLRFLPMVYRGADRLNLVSDRILWEHKAFKLPREEVERLHLVKWYELPWEKDIRTI